MKLEADEELALADILATRTRVFAPEDVGPMDWIIENAKQLAARRRANGWTPERREEVRAQWRRYFAEHPEELEGME